jgi:23S rRNA (adenine2503-C2)-methyltransferase
VKHSGSQNEVRQGAADGKTIPLPVSLQGDFYSLNKADLLCLVTELGQPSYRAGQLYAWQNRGIEDFSELTDQPKALREVLNERFVAFPLTKLEVRRSLRDGTTKILFGLRDGQTIETVGMKYRDGWSVCISSQVGCRMGCAFCASTKAGFVRNLSVGELFAQILAMSRETGEKMRRVTVMGIGEPLENLDNLLAFIARVSDPAGLKMSRRHLTVSTCGLIPELLELADKAPAINVAVSLHAPNQKIRETLMPIAQRYRYDMLLDACRQITEKTGRRLTFEYALLDQVNDSVNDASELAIKLSGLLCHVNLIPANAVEGADFAASPPDKVRQFRQVLGDHGIPVSVRRELGADIMAACGQLRRKRESWLTR